MGFSESQPTTFSILQLFCALFLIMCISICIFYYHYLTYLSLSFCVHDKLCFILGFVSCLDHYPCPFISILFLSHFEEERNSTHWLDARKAYKWLMKCIWYGRKGYGRMDMEMNGIERLWSDHLFHHRLERFPLFYRLWFL